MLNTGFGELMKPESYVVIEQALKKALEKSWKKKAKPLFKSLMDAVKSDDYKAIDELVNSITLESCLDGKEKLVKFYSTQALYFGVSRLIDPDDSGVKKDKLAKEWVDKSFNNLSMVLQVISKTLQKIVRDMITSELNRQHSANYTPGVVIQKGEVIHDFVSSANQAVVGAGGNIFLATSLHTSRLASMGYLMESVIMKKETYIINAILDTRTCQVCEIMNQMVFQTKTLWTRMTQAIEATTVEDLKRLSPWPSQTKAGIETLNSMTTQEIVDSGYDAPPFHPLCRCFIDSTTVETKDINSHNESVQDDNGGEVKQPVKQIINPKLPAAILPENLNPMGASGISPAGLKDALLAGFSAATVPVIAETPVAVYGASLWNFLMGDEDL